MSSSELAATSTRTGTALNMTTLRTRKVRISLTMLMKMMTFPHSAFFLWTNAEFGKAGAEATISSKVITAEESLCFNFYFDLTVGR